MDVGFENPIFACLEVDYTEIDRDPTGEALETSEKVRSNTTHPSVARSRAWLLLTPSRPLPTSPDPPLQLLTYYELDLGLNHVVRKWSEPVDTRANLLIPGSVLVACVCARVPRGPAHAKRVCAGGMIENQCPAGPTDRPACLCVLKTSSHGSTKGTPRCACRFRGARTRSRIRTVACSSSPTRCTEPRYV